MTRGPTHRETESFFASENLFGVSAPSRVVFALGGNGGLFAATRTPIGSPSLWAAHLQTHLGILCFQTCSLH
ncbi:hypothetical protein OG21DRAFT_1505084, partial [Imleria badia]